MFTTGGWSAGPYIIEPAKQTSVSAESIFSKPVSRESPRG
jgi:hypothetical protein